MKRPELARFFTGVGAKRLTRVEVSTEDSNQHEFQGVAELRKVLGDQERREKDGKPFRARYLYLTDEDRKDVWSTLSWYNARRRTSAAGTRAPEWHAYYPATLRLIPENAEPGDLLVIARRTDDMLLVIVAKQGTTTESQLLWLFDLPRDLDKVQTALFDVTPPAVTPLAARQLLTALDIEIDDAGDREREAVERLIKKYPTEFPPTAVFSAAAREAAGTVDCIDDPDGAVVAWYSAEERLFKAYEKPFLERQLRLAMNSESGIDVDAVVTTMKSALQRRKSRAGTALELHLEEIFKANKIRYERHARTELNSRPDFLFPDAATYHRADETNYQHLTMLGVKTTAKDRWRQILAEADKIREKHLLTLEPAISTTQLQEMHKSRVVLVAPADIHNTFSGSSGLQPIRISDFTAFVRLHQENQRRSPSD